MRKLSILLALLVLVAPSFGQAVRTCGTMDHLDRLLAQEPRVAERMAEIEAQTQAALVGPVQSGTTVYTIPVVVHVVWNQPAENISTAQIQTQIDILTDDFRRLNADASNTPASFQGVAADSQIAFCLATVDPNGNPTTGITRTQTSVTSFTDDDDVKFAASGGHDAWPRTDYLNIWVCDLAGFLGYAQFPGGPASTDGIVCAYDSFGDIGTASFPFDLGRTATHEVGHWLNLRHIWGDGGCGVDDLVADTPTSDAPNYGCPATHVSCGTVDMVQNYMDYTDDACMNLFTQGQRTRMRALFNPGGFRASLLNSPGCGTPFTADFTANVTSGFAPLTVTFTDLSSGAVATNWTWAFGDGATSNAQNPIHTYANPGTYSVTLVATGGGMTDSEVKSGYIAVNPAPGPGITDGSFELQTSGATPSGAWGVVFGTGHVVNPDGAVSDNGLPSQGSKWCEIAADSTNGATPPSNPGGVTAPAVGGAGVSQSFTYAGTNGMLSFTASFLRNEAAASTFNDWMSVDVTNGTTTRNVFYKDTFSPATLTSSKYGYAMTAPETVTVALATLFPGSTGTTVFTVTALVGNGSDNIQPSVGYVDNFNLGAVVVPPPVAEFSATPTMAQTGTTVSFTNLTMGTFTTSLWSFGDGSSSTATNPTHAYASAGTFNVSLTVTGPGGIDNETKLGFITITQPPAQTGTIYVSFTANTVVPGVGTVQDEDVVAFDFATQTWSMHFDGSDVGLAGTNVTGLSKLLNFVFVTISSATYTIPGLIGGPDGENVTNNDVIAFALTSSGTNTVATPYFFLDGSDIGLDTSTEALDALWVFFGGYTAVSTTGAASMPGAFGDGNDVFVFLPTSFGAVSAGVWVVAFDGSDVGLETSGENLDALDFDNSPGLLFSTTGSFSALGAVGADEDIGRFMGTFSFMTTGMIELLYDMSSATGLPASADIDAVTFVP